jgi:hypothetical protein
MNGFMVRIIKALVCSVILACHVNGAQPAINQYNARVDEEYLRLCEYYALMHTYLEKTVS